MNRKWLVLRFMIAGGAMMLLYYGTLYTLTSAGVWYLYSSIIGRVLTFIVGFVLQKFWTFRNREIGAAASRQFGLVMMLEGVIFVSNTGGLFVLVERGHLHYLVAQVILTVLLSIFSFFVKRRIFT